jgi:hypothetical protein
VRNSMQGLGGAFEWGEKAITNTRANGVEAEDRTVYARNVK